MKLRNKKTGEIGAPRVEYQEFYIDTENGRTYNYKSLQRMYEEWEDAPEEPKKHYEILGMGVVIERKDAEDEIFRNQGQREIGNYFETKEEAEQAVEKLKAWKRLKDKGFRFVGWCDSVNDNNPDMALFKLNEDAWDTDTCEDLDTCFGGEE